MSLENSSLFDNLELLYRGGSLTQDSAFRLFNAVMRGELDQSQLSALLISLKIKGESPAEIAGAADAMHLPISLAPVVMATIRLIFPVQRLLWPPVVALK